MTERSINWLINTAFPNSFFLDQGLWRASGRPEHINSLPKIADIQNTSRVRNLVDEAIIVSWTRHNNALERSDVSPVASAPDYVLVNYNRVFVTPGYDTFVCPNFQCERLYTRDQIESSSFKCSEHPDETLMQLSHVFVHPECGTVSQISPRICRNPVDNATCGNPLRLHIQYSQMSASYWWCAKCRFERKLPKDATENRPGWKVADLRRTCETCNIDGETYEAMTLTPARTVYKPQRVDLVDLPEAFHTSILQSWFGYELNEVELVSKLPPQLARQYKNDPNSREQLRQMYQMGEMENDGLPRVSPVVQEELANYSGTRSSIVREHSDLPEQVQEFLINDFGTRVNLLDNLSIVRATYGYLVGSSEPESGLLKVFPMGASRYAVLTQRLPTEALMFEFAAGRVLDWLHISEIGHQLNDVRSLREHLVTCDDDDEILRLITGLVHTASHALRRSSERYTGMGRDVIDELLFPRALAFTLYNNRGSELGMFTTTFEGRLREWFMGAQYDLENCPFDPICMSEDIAACPGCLHVGERGCTTLWNRELDRRHLVSLQNSLAPGFWQL